MREIILTRGPVVRRGILMGLVVGVPVLFLRVTNSPFNVPKLALLMAGVSCVVAIRGIELLQGASPRGLERVLVPAAAIAVPLVAAWVASPYKGWSLFGNYDRFQGLMPYLAVVIFGILLADAFYGRARDLAWGFLVAGSVAGGYVVIQVLGLDPFNWAVQGGPTRAGIGTLGNPNFAGGFLAMVLPAAVVLWDQDPARRNTIWKLSLLTGGGWILTFSQGAWAAGIAGLSVTAGLLLASRLSRAVLAGIALAGIVSLGTVGIVIAGIVAPESRFVPSTTQLRGGWWVAATRMGADHPALGRGPNAFAVEGVRYRTVKDAIEQTFEPADDPHSVPLSLFAAGGIPGIVGFAAVLLWLFSIVRRETPRHPSMSAFAGIVVAYFVQSLVSIDEVALRVGLWTGLAGIAACVGVQADTKIKKGRSRNREKSAHNRRRRSRPSHHPRLRAPFGAAALVVLGLAGVWWAGGFLLADTRVHQGTLLLREERIEEGRAQFESALAFREEFGYRRIYSFRLLEAIGDTDDSDARLLTAAMDAYSYLDQFPDVPAMTATARLLRDLAALDPPIDTGVDISDEAIRLYTRALIWDPFNPALRREAAEVIATQERFSDAAALLRSTPETVLDQLSSFWGLIALYEAQAGNEAAAALALDRALSADPSDPNALLAQEILNNSE